jgi:signal recognition particle subunit SRP54
VEASRASRSPVHGFEAPVTAVRPAPGAQAWRPAATRDLLNSEIRRATRLTSPSWAGNLECVFETLSDRLTQVFSGLRGKGRLSPADIDATAREIRIALLEADVALPVVRQFIARIKERAAGAEVSQALNPAQQVIKIVHEELITILGGEARRLRFAKTPPTVILLLGPNGAGKTTLAGKLALWLKEQGNTPMLVAADLHRPNAVDQLQIVGERAGVRVYAPERGGGAGDPVAVARQSIDEARRSQHNIVIIDTAGRLGSDAELMTQARAIRDATDPDEVLFVVDAMTGQDAATTAQAFLDGVDYDGVVLAKLDSDTRGGAALSIAALAGRPIMFASIGEKLTDFEMFYPDRMASRLLDMGDVLSLIEQAEKAFDQDQAQSMANKLITGDGFTLEDFIEQLGMLRKLGPLKNILGMMPGAAKNKEMLDKVNDKDLDRAEAIVRSMTPAERQNPKIINGSRRLRIANGSGVAVGEVSQLVTNFFEGQRQMKMLMNGGMPGMPGMGAMRSARKNAAKKAAKNAKGKRRSGDPRKAASGALSAVQPDEPSAEQEQQAPPQSMEDLAEMLRDAQAAGGVPGFDDEGGFPGFRGGPSALPPGFGGGQGNGGGSLPAAFGKRNKKKK